MEKLRGRMEESIPVLAHLSQDLEAVAITAVAVSVPKRSWKIKELRKKEAAGDLHAFKEVDPEVLEVENQPPVGDSFGLEPEAARCPRNLRKQMRPGTRRQNSQC